MKQVANVFVGFLVIVAVAGCSSNKVKVDIMEAPGIYAEKNFTALGADLSSSNTYPRDIFYVTQRPPSLEPSPRFYQHARGYVLRAGHASVSMANDDSTWNEITDTLLLTDRKQTYPSWIDSIEEYGYIEECVPPLRADVPERENIKPGGKDFINGVNQTLDASSVKDIYVFVHGYKAYFDTPVLVSAQLWYYLGYQGAFIAYSWPSTPNSLAYGADIETANYSGVHLARFIEYLSKNSNADRIHVIGFSAGGRVVINALKQLALTNTTVGRKQLQDKYRMGEVVLISSDYDRDGFITGVEYGILKLMQNLTVYTSETDDALGLSKLVLGRRRLGQLTNDPDDDVREEDLSAVAFGDHLFLINATNAEDAAKGNGHSYFRNSPWVSSDLLTLLRYQLKPEERGLVPQNEGSAIWTFPENYLDVLREHVQQTQLSINEGKDQR